MLANSIKSIKVNVREIRKSFQIGILRLSERKIKDFNRC
jgi:hypothetical protein